MHEWRRLKLSIIMDRVQGSGDNNNIIVVIVVVIDIYDGSNIGR